MAAEECLLRPQDEERVVAEEEEQDDLSPDSEVWELAAED